MFLFFFSGVISPPLFVNKKNELKASKAKNIKAQIKCTVLETLYGTINGVFNPGTKLLTDDNGAQGNKQIPSPKIAVKVVMISSIFSYPLYEIRRIQDEPSIIINGVQAFVYQVSEIEGGNIQTNAATIHGNKIANQPSKHLNLVVLISM